MPLALKAFGAVGNAFDYPYAGYECIPQALLPRHLNPYSDYYQGKGTSAEDYPDLDGSTGLLVCSDYVEQQP